jgi:hypothetical protein
MEGEQCINHGRHCHKREQARGDSAHRVSEVEEANRQATENDGEVEP